MDKKKFTKIFNSLTLEDLQEINRQYFNVEDGDMQDFVQDSYYEFETRNTKSGLFNLMSHSISEMLSNAYWRGAEDMLERFTGKGFELPF